MAPIGLFTVGRRPAVMEHNLLNQRFMKRNEVSRIDSTWPVWSWYSFEISNTLNLTHLRYPLFWNFDTVEENVKSLKWFFSKNAIVEARQTPLPLTDHVRVASQQCKTSCRKKTHKVHVLIIKHMTFSIHTHTHIYIDISTCTCMLTAVCRLLYLWSVYRKVLEKLFTLNEPLFGLLLFDTSKASLSIPPPRAVQCPGVDCQRSDSFASICLCLKLSLSLSLSISTAGTRLTSHIDRSVQWLHTEAWQ